MTKIRVGVYQLMFDNQSPLAGPKLVSANRGCVLNMGYA